MVSGISTKKLLAALAVLTVCAGLVMVRESKVSTVANYPEVATIGSGTPSLNELSKRFGELAQVKGAEYSFAVLREAILPLDTDIHLIAHAIGHELYAQQGIEGMSVCTQEFRNGCSHSIVIETMQELGDGDSVRKLIDDACHSAPGGGSAYSMCYHGLGHGVFAYYGFSFPQTVAFCEKTGTKEYDFVQSKECIGGAVMELVGGGGHDVELWVKANRKYFDPKNPLAPCDTALIPESAKASCYVYMSPHFMEYAGANMQTFTDTQLSRGMAVCALLPHGANRSACAGAFGKDFPHNVGGHDVRKLDEGLYTDEQLRAVENLCNHASDEADALVCKSYALSTFFWGGDAEPSVSARFCSLLRDSKSQDFCFHDLAVSISRYIPRGQSRSERCALIPEQYRSLCLEGES